MHLPSPSVSDKRLSSGNPAVMLKEFFLGFHNGISDSEYSTKEDVIEFLTEIW